MGRQERQRSGNALRRQPLFQVRRMTRLSARLETARFLGLGFGGRCRVAGSGRGQILVLEFVCEVDQQPGLILVSDFQLSHAGFQFGNAGIALAAAGTQWNIHTFTLAGSAAFSCASLGEVNDYVFFMTREPTRPFSCPT
jgi:hypothetical protein